MGKDAYTRPGDKDLIDGVTSLFVPSAPFKPAAPDEGAPIAGISV